jgi:hypothetical protein
MCWVTSFERRRSIFPPVAPYNCSLTSSAAIFTTSRPSSVFIAVINEADDVCENDEVADGEDGEEVEEDEEVAVEEIVDEAEEEVEEEEEEEEEFEKEVVGSKTTIVVLLIGTVRIPAYCCSRKRHSIWVEISSWSPSMQNKLNRSPE